MGSKDCLHLAKFFNHQVLLSFYVIHLDMPWKKTKQNKKNEVEKYSL